MSLVISEVRPDDYEDIIVLLRDVVAGGGASGAAAGGSEVSSPDAGAASVAGAEPGPDTDSKAGTDTDSEAGADTTDSEAGGGVDAGLGSMVCAVDKPQCTSVLSLVAREGCRLVGTILCFHDGEAGYRHQVAIASSHADSDLARELIDRALQKLINRGAKKCRISLPGEVQHDPFWELVSWGDRPRWREPSDSNTVKMERFKAQHGVPVEPGEPTGGGTGSVAITPQGSPSGLSDTSGDEAADIAAGASDPLSSPMEPDLDAQAETVIAAGVPVST